MDSYNIRKQELLQRGFFLQRMMSPRRIMRLIRNIRPRRTPLELVRIGADADGGYLVPNDLDGIAACFSPGVEANASFEIDLLNRFGINSHLADYSVDGPPMQFRPKSFAKKFVGSYVSEKFITLDAWMAQQPEYRTGRDFLLQMDIEGAEYKTLLSLSEANLRRFRIIVVEIHSVENWCDWAFFDIVETMFAKLLKYFQVVHNHPNNCCGMVNMGGIVAPRVFELTFLRRDRAFAPGFQESFPHPLDRPNRPDQPALALPPAWYSSEEDAALLPGRPGPGSAQAG